MAKLFYWLALFVTLVGFVNLFTSMANFRIPFVSTTLVPFFNQFTVGVAVWDAAGHSNIVTGEHLVFLFSLGISLILLIIGSQFKRK